ncbi:MAG: HAMP domain-containing sensor histidine kinase [Caldilineaceae bacterium]
MNYLWTLHRRIEWLTLFSYLFIIGMELVILRTIAGSPAANFVRYLVFIVIVGASLLVVRQQVIQPIKEIQTMSLHIADGNYHERLPAFVSVELNELAQTFNRMVERIESSEQRRIELIGVVAHELRTPLSAIKATSEGLIDGVLPAETATFFNIHREVNRLQRIVQQLEELSRAESGQIILKKEQTDFANLVQSVCDRLHNQYDDKEVTLHTDLQSPLPQLWLDEDRITQVLINLLGNALQYTPAHGTVTIRVRADHEWVTTQVIDTGIGLEPEQLTLVFERFYRVDKSRSRQSGGNGIGLTIAQYLVQAHGGHIWAESDGLGQGSTFSFTLPRQPNV